MSVELGLKKMNTLEQEKKNLLLKLFNANELLSTKIAYLAKNFGNFLKNNNRRARIRNNVDSKNVKQNDTAKNNNVEKSKDKVGQFSNNSLGQQCYGCQGYGHLKFECPTFLRSKGKTMAVTLSDDEVSLLLLQ